MSDPKASSKSLSPQRITEMAWGFAPMLIIHAATKNHVFDVLAAGPKTLDELAAATKSSKRGLRSLVEALVGFELVQRQKDRFSLAPDTAAFLVSGKPGYLGGLVEHFSAQLLDNWRQLPEIVRTGKPATRVDNDEQGAEFFSKFVEDLFNLNYAGADSLAEELSKSLPAHSGALKILDIAAGSGVWSIPLAKRVAQRHQLGERLNTIEGNIETVDFGRGFHVATLGHILHSEGETKSRKLLKKVFDSLAPGGIIAIAEFVPNDDRNGPAYPLLFAVNMLVHTEDGDTFTFQQMSGWLSEIGYKQIRKVEVPAPSPIIVAVKP